MSKEREFIGVDLAKGKDMTTCLEPGQGGSEMLKKRQQASGLKCTECDCPLPEGWMIPYSQRGNKYYCSKCW